MEAESDSFSEDGTRTMEVVRMEGVEDHSVLPPLVVIDGANVAYEYGSHAGGSPGRGPSTGGGRVRNKRSGGAGVADARGLLVASAYFLRQGVRVKVVLPSSWFRRKPNPRDDDRTNAMMQTEEQDVIHELRRLGLLVASPPTDDDDAYAIALARRESARVAARYRLHHHSLHHAGKLEDDPNHLLPFPSQRGGAFVLSNDLFRDAQQRDPSLRSWLDSGDADLATGTSAEARRSSLSSAALASSPVGACPGRISYTFADLGSMDDRGEPCFDFVPNPRHPLIAWSERQIRRQEHQHPH
jgi:hypothetical protein